MPSRDDNYDFIKIIGKGAFGIVELWQQRFNDEKLVAAKRVHVGEMTAEEVERTRQEAQVLKSLQHPHVVKYLGSWVSRQKEDLIIIQEYCEGGDLAHFIYFKKKSGEQISEELVMQWLAQLTHALQYCHKKARILHRDFKPSNIFLSEDLQSVRLGDFGIAKNLRSTASLCQTVVGTQAYMSPELTRMQKYGPKTEVWSLGATLYEMCTHKKLYDSPDILELVEKISSSSEAPRLSPDLGYSTELQDICAAMLVKDSGARPTLSDMLTNHALLRVTVLQLERNMDWGESLVPGEDPKLEVSLEAQDKLQALFKKHSKNGLLSKTELASLLHKLHPKWDSGVARILLKAADEDGDENLDCEEFLSWLLAGNSEWNPIKQAMMLSVDEDDPEPRVDRSKTEKASEEAPPEGESFAALAANARQRLLKPTAERTSLSLKEAAAMKDLVELARQHKELTDLLQQFPLDKEAEAMSTVAFAKWSVSRLKEYLTSHGGTLDGAVEKHELVERCQKLHLEQNGSAEGADEEDLAYAERIDARLRCLRLLQDQTDPDPIQLAIALRQAQSLLVEEPCVTAILSHSQRLGMRAEDKLKTAKTVPEMEQALEIMEAVKDVKLPDGHTNCVSSMKLDEANFRLRGVRSKEKKIGVRSHCGPFVKTSSLKGDSTLQQAKLQLAQVWCRPVEALDFFAADGSPLDTEERWEGLVRGTDSIEVNLVLDRGRLLGRKGSKAGAKPKAKLTAKRSLAGLAASSSPWRN